MNKSDYNNFIESKAITVKPSGFDVPIGELNPILFDFQRDIVRWGRWQREKRRSSRAAEPVRQFAVGEQIFFEGFSDKFINEQ
ncbi:MAG: hypothetical protein K2O14_13290 [Oscillospiraceae bacterium]|nr:hypothetical protein [Oscillospiraceae bacterium]